MADARHGWHACMAGALLLLTACAAAPPLPTPRQPVVLLGEVHDNALQHAQRLRVFRALLASGARPALALEQLDRDRQGAIDTLRRRQPAPEADDIIQAAGPEKAGWNWDFYRPFITLALQHDLPIVAANVSRTEARQVMQQGLAASGFDATVPPDVLAAHSRDIQASHCGMVDTATGRRMAQAQVARDQFMAQVLEINADRGVVLLAGNGHVRIDVGVPRWLSPATRARSEAIGWLEAGPALEAERSAYDRVQVTPPATRPDPCAGMSRGRDAGASAPYLPPPSPTPSPTRSPTP